MIVSNWLFDIVLFGALLLAALADQAFPQLAGAASLVAVGAASYIAAQEWSDALLRRRIWSQESLATAIALSTLDFIYLWWRNESDLSLLVLSIGLMMASLMMAIATISAVGTALKDTSLAPLGGWILTAGAAFALGVLAGVLALFLGGGATPFAKVLVLGIALFGWKVRETILPPGANVHAYNAGLVAGASTGVREPAVPATHTQPWFLLPQRGTLLDRFMPVLILGALLFVVTRQIKLPDLWTPTPPAVADNGTTDNGATANGETP